MAQVAAFVVLARITTAYYFAYFLIILPLLGLFETPKPLPASITDAVLEKAKHGKAAASGSGQPAGATAAPETKG